MLRLRALFACLLLAAVATPAAAGLSPYVRADFGGHQLRMTDANQFVTNLRHDFETAGFTPDLHKVGVGNGPGISAGVWLLPAFRVGATYSYDLTQVNNYVHEPGVLWYADEAQFRMTEVGGEAALRVQKWAGLTLGARVAKGTARLSEGYAWENYVGGSVLYSDGVGTKTLTTYGGWVGLDQTNLAGVAGYVRLGWQYRDVGRITSSVRYDDGVSTWEDEAQSVWLDYSGFYFKVGVGYDLLH